MFKRLKKDKKATDLGWIKKSSEVYEDPSEKLNFEDEPESTEIYVIEDEFVSKWNKYSEREAEVEIELSAVAEKIVFEDDNTPVEAYVKKYDILQKKREIIFKRKSDIVHAVAVSLDLESRVYDFFSDPGVIVRALEDGRTTFEY